MNQIAELNSDTERIKVINQLYSLEKFLHTAAISKDCSPDKIKEIVHLSLLHSLDKNQDTPLHLAICYRVPIEVIYELLRLGANPNARNSDQSTPLHEAVRLLKDEYTDRTLSFLLCHMINLKKYDISYKYKVLTVLFEFGAHPDETVFQNYCVVKLSDTDILKVSKLIMQYLIVNEFRNNSERAIKLANSYKYQEIVDLSVFLGRICYEKLAEYRIDLIGEVISMMSDKLDENNTLFSFLSLHCSSGLAYSKSDESVLYKVLMKFHYNEYQCCHDLFQASIKWEALLSMLYNSGIYVKKYVQNNLNNAQNVIQLNGDLVFDIASYLSKSDMMNLVLAYFNVSKEESVIKGCDSEKIKLKKKK